MHNGYTSDTPRNHLGHGANRVAKGHQPSAGVKVRGLGVSMLYPGIVHSVSRVYLGGYLCCIWGVSGVYLVYLGHSILAPAKGAWPLATLLTPPQTHHRLHAGYTPTHLATLMDTPRIYPRTHPGYTLNTHPRYIKVMAYSAIFGNLQTY